MTPTPSSRPELPASAISIGIAATSAALLMTELALTRIFSVTMFYHFAFLAISVALFGLSASGVFVYLRRRKLAEFGTPELLSAAALLHSATTLAALALLVRIPVALSYSPQNAVRLLAIYVLAALPFFTGGAVVSMAFARLTSRINALYGADLLGAAIGCLALVPLLNELGAPGVVLSASALSAVAAACFAPQRLRRRVTLAAALLALGPPVLHIAGVNPFEVIYTKGVERGHILFSKWNSFSRVAVYDHAHADWSLSPNSPEKTVPSLMMDIDASASTPILKGTGKVTDAAYLKYELTAFAYHFVDSSAGFSALVIGPGGGRDIVSALVFGARHVDGVEINPIIVRDVMLARFRDYSGGIYSNPRVSIHVEDGRSFVRRSARRFDVIQASLVDTWAATAAGAYTLTENSLYTTEAFSDYLDHLTDSGVLTITRWVFDGLRLVSLAQEAYEQRGLNAARHLAIVRHKNVMTFMLKKAPFSEDEVRKLHGLAADLDFSVLYAPGMTTLPAMPQPVEMTRLGTSLADYGNLIRAPDRQRFLDDYRLDVRATTDDRPFFFHTTRLENQLKVASGRSILFGNGLGALLSLFGISLVLVVLFVIGPLLVRSARPGPGWGGWLCYFGALGAGFMLLEVGLLQRFVLLLGHPVYSLTVTLFSLLLGTSLGSMISRRVPIERTRRFTVATLFIVAGGIALAAGLVARVVDYCIPWPLPARIAAAVATLVPFGVLLGVGLPGGMRLLDRSRRDLVAWGWGMNGAFSVVGATLAIFIAMNWGFSATLAAAGLAYVVAASTLATRSIT